MACLLKHQELGKFMCEAVFSFQARRTIERAGKRGGGGGFSFVPRALKRIDCRAGQCGSKVQCEGLYLVKNVQTFTFAIG